MGCIVVTVVIGSVGSVAIGVGVPTCIGTADGAGDGSCVGVGLGIDVCGAADGAGEGSCVGVGLGAAVSGSRHAVPWTIDSTRRASRSDDDLATYASPSVVAIAII